MHNFDINSFDFLDGHVKKWKGGELNPLKRGVLFLDLYLFQRRSKVTFVLVKHITSLQYAVLSEHKLKK